MKIYFANNKYVMSDGVHEEYHNGFTYLSFNIVNTNLSFDALKSFLSNSNNLNKITIVDDNNIALLTFIEKYHSLYNLTYSLTEGNDNHYINVQLSSSEDGLEAMKK